MPPPGAPQVSLSEDEAAYALACILAGSDGKVTHAETRRVEGEWLRFAASRGLKPEQARQIAARCRDLRSTVGTPSLLAACETTLRQAPNARDAVIMAVQVAYADGELGGAEKAQLERMLALVGLSIDQLPSRTGTMRKSPS